MALVALALRVGDVQRVGPELLIGFMANDGTCADADLNARFTALHKNGSRPHQRGLGAEAL